MTCLKGADNLNDHIEVYGSFQPTDHKEQVVPAKCEEMLEGMILNTKKNQIIKSAGVHQVEEVKGRKVLLLPQMILPAARR
jgi:hypothetical protein